MKGVILAGGNATRWGKVGNLFNKHMIPVYDQPQVDLCLKKFREAGIEDIAIILGGKHPEQVRDYLGREDFTYIYQGEPKGIGHAVLLTKDFVGDDNVIIHLGDQYYEASIKDFVENLENTDTDISLLLKWDKHANRHSVVTVTNNKVVGIVEKPEEPEDGYVMVGVYGFSPKIFPILEQLKPSTRGEYELSDAVWLGIKSGLNYNYEILSGIWIDVGTPENLLKASIVESIIKEREGG